MTIIKRRNILLNALTISLLLISLNTPDTSALTCHPGQSKVTILSEDFESWPPPGWTLLNHSIIHPDNPFWILNALGWELGIYGEYLHECAGPGSPYYDVEPNYASGSGYADDYADADDDAQGRCAGWVQTLAEMRTPPLDVSDYAAIELEFKMDYYDAGYQDYAEVLISSDGGSSWTVLQTWTSSARGPLTLTYDLTPHAGCSKNMIVSWYYHDDVLKESKWWQVDEVRIYGCPSPGDATNSEGQVRDDYLTKESIYATGGGFSPITPVDIYVVNDLAWSDGMGIPSDVSSDGKNTATTDASGNIGPVLVWPAPTAIGAYDIVFDADQNGKYDTSTDGVDHICHPGFTVSSFDTGSVAVGGFSIPTIKFTVILPYLALGCLLGIIASVLVTRKGYKS
jgi:hypothetical protein